MAFIPTLVLFYTLTCSLLVTTALPTSTNVDDEVIYGYTEVPKNKAERYNKAGTLLEEANNDVTQIGTGVYTTPGRGGWYNLPGNWHCVIYGSHDALKRVGKSWIPETYEGHDLWWVNDEEIYKYIKGIDDKWDAHKTLRLALIDSPSKAGEFQMVIPFYLLNSRGGAMGIRTECVEKAEDLPKDVVNYNDWGVKGEKVDPYADPESDDDDWADNPLISGA